MLGTTTYLKQAVSWEKEKAWFMTVWISILMIMMMMMMMEGCICPSHLGRIMLEGRSKRKEERGKGDDNVKKLRRRRGGGTSLVLLMTTWE